MHGYGEAKLWGLQLARDLRDWKNGEIDWADIDTGALLSGPPGCGKSSFAAALAQTCEVSLVLASAAKWQAKGHLGDYLKAMHASFAEAKRRQPSILFLDEFDSFSDRDTEDQNSDYRRQCINGLLEALDGADGRHGVVVVGATNYPDAIDAALLRPGRIERHLRIPPPDADARRAILAQHMGVGWVPPDLAEFVENTVGATRADIAFIAKSARRLARYRQTAVTARELADALPHRTLLSDEDLRRVAAHEGGHAIVGHLLGQDKLKAVTIVSSVVDGRGSQHLGETLFIANPSVLRSAAYHRDRIAMLLGGMAAEVVMFGHFSDGAGSGPTSDLALASDLATSLESQLGMGQRLDWSRSKTMEELRIRDLDLRRAVDRILSEEFERVKAILEPRREAFSALMEDLVASKRVSGDAVASLLDTVPHPNLHPS